MEINSEPSLMDEAQLGKPINIGISGIQHVIRYIQKGTAEVRDLLLNECELLYECRSCRNMFRSLANFVIHKREFCKQHFCENMVLFTSEDSPQEEVVVVQPESPKVENPEENDPMETNQSDKESCTDENSENLEQNVEISTTKIYQPPVKTNKLFPVVSNKNWAENEETVSNHSSAVTFYTRCIQNLEQKASSNSSNHNSVITLKPIRSNPNAVYQTINTNSNTASKTERVDYYTPVNEREQVSTETTKKSSSPVKKAVHSENASSSRQRHDSDGLTIVERLKEIKDCDIKELKCLKCKSQYTSIKTLDFHMRTIHSHNRIYYPCLFCSTSFVQLWGVTRHMISVHKKTKEQVNRLREAVRRKAFYRHNDKTSLDKNEDKLKIGSTVKTKSFKKNHTHSKFEDKSSNAVTKKNQQYHQCGKCKRSFDRRSSQITHEKFCVNKIAITSQPKVVLKDASAMMTSRLLAGASPLKSSVLIKDRPAVFNSGRPKRNAKKKAEVDFVDISAIGYQRIVNKPENNVKKQPPGNLEKKLLAIMNIKKILCLKCNRRFSTFPNLRRHAAIHIGWYRFKCKYCEYQSYNRSDCRTHLLRAHLQGKTSNVQVDKLVVDLPTEQKQIKKDNIQKTSAVKKATAQLSETESPPESPPQSQTTKLSNNSSSTNSPVKNAENNNNRASSALNSVSNSNKANSNSVTNNSSASSTAKNRNITYQSIKTTRLSYRRADGPNFNSGDNMLTLVTRSGSYPKADLFSKYFQARNVDSKKKNEDSVHSNDNQSSSESEVIDQMSTQHASPRTLPKMLADEAPMLKSSEINNTSIDVSKDMEYSDKCNSTTKGIVLFSDDPDSEIY